EHFAAASLGVLRQLFPHSRARVLELVRRLAVLRQVVLRLLLRLRDPPLELLDVSGLERRLRGRLGVALPVFPPPAPVDDLDRDFAFVRHQFPASGFRLPASGFEGSKTKERASST